MITCWFQLQTRETHAALWKWLWMVAAILIMYNPLTKGYSVCAIQSNLCRASVIPGEIGNVNMDLCHWRRVDRAQMLISIRAQTLRVNMGQEPCSHSHRVIGGHQTLLPPPSLYPLQQLLIESKKKRETDWLNKCKPLPKANEMCGLCLLPVSVHLSCSIV